MKNTEKYNIREHKDEIITHIIKSLIWLVITSLISVAITVLKFIKNDPTLLLIFLYIGLGANIILFVYNIISLIQALKNSNKTSSITPLTDFRITCVETELDFTDREHVVSTLFYDMIAIGDSVEYFEKEMIWTGDKIQDTTIEQDNKDCELKLFNSDNSLRKYRIVFKSKLARQEPIHFKLKTLASDNQHMMLPISSYMVKHQIDKLIIRVVAPPNLLKNVKKSIYADLSRQIQIGQSEEVPLKVIAQKDCYEITIDNPTLLYRYFLEWEFTNI